MKWITRLFVGIMAIALAATSVVWVADATIWNSTYLQATATKTDLAAKLATSLPDAAAAYAPGNEAKTAVASVVTPAYVQTQLGQIIPNFVAAFRHGGADPTLNLTDLGQQLSLKNVPVPASLTKVIDTPQPLVPDNLSDPLRHLGNATSDLKLLAPLATLIAAVMIIVVARHHRYAELAIGLGLGAVFTGVAALIVQLPPRIIGAALDTSIAKPLVPAIRGFMQAIATDQTHRLLVIAVGFVIVAAGLMVVHWILDLLWRMRRHKEPKEATEA